MAVMVLLFPGCSGKHEGLILGEMTKKMLPELKEEARSKKPVFVAGQKCLHKAQTVKEANACNAMMMKMNPDFEIGNFDTWGEKELAEVDKMANTYIAFYDCLLAAKNISQAMECKEPEGY